MAEFSGMHALEYVRSRVADHPSPETLEGLRDRAILLVGLQVGLRAPKSPRWLSVICIRIAAATRCASPRRAAVPPASQQPRKPSRAFYIDEHEQHAIAWKRPDKKFEITI